MVATPQDHKVKVEKIEVDLPDGVDDDGKPKTRKAPALRTVVRGITVTVPEEALDDFELADEMARIDDGQGHRFAPVARRLFGDDYKRIMDELRGENGRVGLEAAITFINETLVALNPN